MEQKRCISSLTLDQLAAELKAMGQPGFRAKQIFHWVHQKLATEFSAMTDQPKTLLAKLEEQFYIAAPQIERRQEAKDGTVKYLLRMADGNCIETVVMRYHYGNTVCVSTQVGCRMGCRFCASTQAGRVRNLEAGEICAEIYTAQKDIGERISHIVLMGIGEPLDNFDEVMRFLENITSPEGVNIGMRNISLSTCGLVPKIDQLAEKKLQLTLSVSLHAPNNEIRSGMMPVNDAYPVEVLMQAVRRYQDTTGRRVSFEYSMVRGVNDSDACAKQLANLIRGMGAHVNLIPINPVDGSPYSATDAANVRRFQQKLESLGVNATVRRRLGSEISAACGQLRRDEMKGKAYGDAYETSRKNRRGPRPAGKSGRLPGRGTARRCGLGAGVRRHGRRKGRAGSLPQRLRCHRALLPGAVPPVHAGGGRDFFEAGAHQRQPLRLPESGPGGSAGRDGHHRRLRSGAGRAGLFVPRGGLPRLPVPGRCTHAAHP